MARFEQGQYAKLKLNVADGEMPVKVYFNKGL